jgi:CubicO group peptidase (beta-lactamase class C family)
MKTGLRALACVAAVASTAGCVMTAPKMEPKTAQVPAAGEAQARVLEGILRSAMQRNGIVGMSAVVVSGDQRLLSAGYGFADKTRRIPVTPDTAFPIASITKLFTATAVMQLVERGAVDLDSAASRYLPGLIRQGSPDPQPTVRQLLTHHGGLQGTIMEGFELKEPDPSAYRQVPRLLAGMAPVAPPDTVFAYCNAGYSLLGCIIEEASGTGYAEFVERGILGPLGMSDTRFFLAGPDAEGAAMGYDGSAQVPVYPIRDVPAGALISTGADMEKFMRFVFDQGREGVLGRDAFEEMTRRQNGGAALDGDFSIGLGYWLINPIAVDDVFASHAGDIPPFHTVLVTIPDRRIGVFLAANSSRDPSALIPLAVELIRTAYSGQAGAPVEDPPLAPRIRLDQAALDGMAGRYASPMGLIEVQPKRGKLLTRALGLPLELIPREDGSFTAELSLLGLLSVPLSPLRALRFSRLQFGSRVYLRITALGIMAGVAERLSPLAVPGVWKARAGKYAIIPRDKNANYRWPRDITLGFDERSGLLLLTHTFAGQRASFPVLARNDTEAVIAGTGTGLGDGITAREEDGCVFLDWSGMVLKRE